MCEEHNNHQSKETFISLFKILNAGFGLWEAIFSIGGTAMAWEFDVTIASCKLLDDIDAHETMTPTKICWGFLLLLLLKLPGPVEYTTVQDEKKTTNQFSEYVNVSRTNQSSCKTSIYRLHASLWLVEWHNSYFDPI